MPFISASPAVVLKMFSVLLIVCFPTLRAGNPKGRLESIRVLHLCGDLPMTRFLCRGNLAFRHQLELFQLALGPWGCSRSLPPAEVICQIGSLLEPAFWSLRFRQSLCNLQPGKLEIGFQRSEGVIEFLATFIKSGKSERSGKPPLLLPKELLKSVFHILYSLCFFRSCCCAAFAVVLQLSQTQHCQSKDVNV